MSDQRIIKYRVFLKKEKLMLPVKSIDFEAREVTLLTVAVDISPVRKKPLPKGAIGECMHDQVQKFEDIILMEFIGNKDKYSMDIFEGDILMHCDRTIIVEDIRDIDSDLMSMSDVDWGIVGNIYEDKEKMKDEL